MGKKLSVGGQAVIEGVMIRGPTKYAVAVRKNKRITAKSGAIHPKNRFFRLPFVRGFVNLAEMLAIGIKSLMWSAEQAAPKEENIGKKELAFTIFVSIGFAILFFIALPYFLTNLLGFYEEKKPFLFNLIDGAIRILIFLIYIVSISFMRDVKILFQYHGAEHKAIHCYEKSKKLNVQNVQKFTTLHPRCGTSFLLIVFTISIFVFSLLPSIVIYLFPDFLSLNTFVRKSILFPVRILLIPLIAGISYEILKMSDKKQNNFMFKLVSMPGLWLQKITTQEPTNRQVEVAVSSLKKLLAMENKKK